MLVYFGGHSQIRSFAEKMLGRFPRLQQTKTKTAADLIVDYSDVDYASIRDHQIVILLERDRSAGHGEPHYGRNVLVLDPHTALDTLENFVRNLSNCCEQ